MFLVTAKSVVLLQVVAPHCRTRIIKAMIPEKSILFREHCDVGCGFLDVYKT